MVSARVLLLAGTLASATQAFLYLPAGTPSSSATAHARRGGVCHVLRMEAEEGPSRSANSISRRNTVRNVLLGAAAIMGLPSRSPAAFFGGASDLEVKLDEVAKGRSRVEEVLTGLKKKELRGGPEDSLVVYRYSASYFKPVQEKMVALTPLIKLGDEEKQKRFDTLPLLLKGHLFELDAAIKSQKASEQLEEVEEVAETIDEFLALVKGKLGEGAVKSYIADSRAQEEAMKNYYGLFTCETYGRKRLPDSNLCASTDE